MNNTEKETDRIENFSDGIFAFAITLLALELHFPKIENIASNAVLTRAVANNWPSYIAFITSFISILIMWMNHHAIFYQIHKINPQIIFANGFLLLFVVAVPYPTSLIAKYILSPAANTASVVYAGLSVLINIAYNLLLYTVTKYPGLLKNNNNKESIKILQRNSLIGLPAYLISFFVAFYSAAASLTIFVLLWIFWAITAIKSNNNENAR